jgi:hypothetical protein
LHRTAKERRRCCKEEGSYDFKDRKEVKEEETASGKLRTDIVNSKSGPGNQFYIPLRWAPW